VDSVGSQIIEYARRPLIIVGPAGDASGLGRDIAVALDGVHDAAPLLSTAMAWAALLDAPLRLVTVYEPVLPDLRRPEHFTRRHGPPTDPDAYLDDLAVGLDRDPHDGIEAVALADPVSVADGLAQHLRDRPALLLVAGAPRGKHPLLPGVLRELVHHVSIPVLVVPNAQLEPDEALVDAAERGEP
jgi:nucleotide-binding universal stress UspA family protein